MAGKSEDRTSTYSRQREKRLQERLELIKRRHRELILKPRELIAEDLAVELGDGYDPYYDQEELRIMEDSYGLDDF